MSEIGVVSISTLSKSKASDIDLWIIFDIECSVVGLIEYLPIIMVYSDSKPPE